MNQTFTQNTERVEGWAEQRMVHIMLSFIQMYIKFDNLIEWKNHEPTHLNLWLVRPLAKEEWKCLGGNIQLDQGFSGTGQFGGNSYNAHAFKVHTKISVSDQT